MTHFPERIPELRRLYLGDEPTARRLLSAQLQPQQVLLRLAGINTPEEAQACQGLYVRIGHDQAQSLEAGQYFHWQLIGAQVNDEAGAPLGILAEIIETGANDVYVIRSETGPELLLPAIAEVIRQVDTDQGTITVRLLPGLG